MADLAPADAVDYYTRGLWTCSGGADGGVKGIQLDLAIGLGFCTASVRQNWIS